jgi:malic enzyme
VPNPLDKRVHQAVAKSVAMKAMEQGIAQADYVSYTED